MDEVREVELDWKEANKTHDEEVFAPQVDKGIVSPEDNEISHQNLRADLQARMQKDNTQDASAPQVNPEQPQAPQPPVPQAVDQAPAPEPKQDAPKEKTPQEILAELGLKEEPKKRVIDDGNGNMREYIQKPLSFMGKMQFLSYIGEVLDKAMSGQNALQLGSLFEVPTRGDMLSAQDFSDAQTFVQAVGKLLVYAPDFLTKSYCIWLRVPEYEREWVSDVMEENLTDEEGFDIIDTFIDQNWGTLQGFFIEKLPMLRDRLQARYRASQSEPSKP